MERTANRRFEFRHLLGRGGFGDVYRAVMTTPGGLEADVAVKLLRTEGDGDHVRRLRDEGRLLSALQHPSILRVWDLANLDGRVALVTEYVPGQDLAECFAGEDPIPTRALLEVVAQVAEGLQAAWAGLRPGSTTPMRIVHRDIKPSNLRIGPHGQVKILDFGIAHAQHADREARTGANSTLGSLAYMAPERFSKRPPGPECDVYALGCVLFEGLTGRRLHPEAAPLDMLGLAGDAAAWEAHLEASLAELPDGLDPELTELVRQACAHAPDVRPTAGALAERCDALADAAPGAPLKRWARDRDWPDPDPRSGALNGRVMTDGTLDTGATQAIGDWSSETYQFDGPPAEWTGDKAEAGLTGDQPRRALPLPWIGGAALVVALLGVGWLATRGPSVEEPAEVPELTAPEPTSQPRRVRRSKVKRSRPAPAPTVAEPSPTVAPAPSPVAPPAPAPRTAADALGPSGGGSPEPAPRPPPPPPEGSVAAEQIVAPEPTAAPEPVPTGKVVVSGAELVRVEVAGETVPADAVPARTEAFLVIDFGTDTHRIGPHLVPEGLTLSLRCVAMTQDCAVE